MPNHVTHKMIVRGDRSVVESFTLRHVRDGCLSFDTVIPRPSSLGGNWSSVHEEGAVLLVLKSLGEMAGIFPYGSPNLRWSAALLAKWEAKLDEQCLAPPETDWRKMTRAWLVNIVEHGHGSWYGWSIEHWGTKWDAYNGSCETHDDKLVLKFDTAWSTPMPVLLKLEELWPMLSFEIYAYDEGHGFACAGFLGANADPRYGIVEVTPELYEIVHGHPYPREDE